MSVLRRRGGVFGLGIVDRILPKKGADGGKGGGTSSDVQSRLSSLESSQGAILTKLSDQVRRLDATVSELQKVQARLEETIDKTKETFADVTGAANKLASDTKGKLNTLTSEFNQVRDKVKLAGDAVTDARNQLGGIQDFLKPLRDKFPSGPALTDFLDKAKATAADFPSVRQYIDQVKARFPTSQTFAQFIDKVKGAIEVELPNVRALIKAAQDNVAKITGLINEAKARVDATVKAIKCLVGVTRGLVAKFSDLSGITTKLTSVTDGLKARMAALKEASGVVGDIMQAVKDAFEDMRARVEDVRDDVVTGGKDKTRPSATDAIKNFAGSVTGPASKLRDRFGEIRAQFKDKLAVAFGGANLDFDGMKNNFGSLGKTFDEVKTQFEACKAGAIPDVASTTEELVEVPRLLRPLLRKKAPPPAAKAVSGPDWSRVPEATTPEWEG